MVAAQATGAPHRSECGNQSAAAKQRVSSFDIFCD
jgi:hypothetical protein